MARSITGSMRQLMSQYVRGCRIRNIYWNLTEEQFVELTSKNCIYCGKKPTNRYHSYVYSGIDRLDNDRGYEYKNCAPACKECNSIKGEHLSYSEMIAVATTIREHRKNGKKAQKS